MRDLSERELYILRNIECRIDELREISNILSDAHNNGDLFLSVKQELDDLRLKRHDILNGTNKYKIKQLELEILRLKSIRDNVAYFKKKKYTKAIQEHSKEIKKLKKEY